MHASTCVELFFEDCRVGVGNLLSEEEHGMRLALSTLDEGRIGIASQAVGIAVAALEASINYAKKRIQFGHPIAEYQAVQWMLADVATQIDAARLLTYRAAYLLNKIEIIIPQQGIYPLSHLQPSIVVSQT